MYDDLFRDECLLHFYFHDSICLSGDNDFCYICKCYIKFLSFLLNTKSVFRSFVFCHCHVHHLKGYLHLRTPDWLRFENCMLHVFIKISTKLCKI